MGNLGKLWILYFWLSHTQKNLFFLSVKIRQQKNEDPVKPLIIVLVLLWKLGMKNVTDGESDLTNVDDPILKAIAKYKNHLSILRIKDYMKDRD